MPNLDLDTLMVLTPALPLAAAVLIALAGKRVLKGASHLPAVLAIGGSFFLSLLLLGKVHEQADQAEGALGWEHTRTLWTWVDLPQAMDAPERAARVGSGGAAEAPPARVPFRLDITLRADTLTSMMLCMVTFISTLVVIYAASYMHGDPGYWRFFAYVSLFVFSMTMLVSASSFLLLYVFWEAVGACSYLLIGFWFARPEASAAAKKAFLVNRIGDFGFALGVFLLWTTYGTLNFHDTEVSGVLGASRLSSGAFAGGGLGLAIALLLFVGACGKSAQFPLHVWLPDAMEGPTPVSALIHAATMVTAGVYMVARCTPLFLAGSLDLGCCALSASDIVAMVGGVTALLAGLIALTQHDLKRVLAYSTVSQLGYMFLSLGTGTLAGVIAGMFHLFTHAFFKALLFLGAGSVMHAMGGVIDMRRFGGLRRVMPLTHATFLVGCLALAGVFPLAGFWSKDAILSALHDRAHHGATLFTWLYGLAMGTAFLTAYYTFRAFFRTFYGPEEIPPEAGHHAHESPQAMTVPLMVLAACAVGVGYYFESGHRFLEFLGHAPQLAYAAGEATRGPLGEFHTDIALYGSLVGISGIALAAYLFLGERSEVNWLLRQPWLRPLHALSYGKFFLDGIYQTLLVWPLRLQAGLLAWLDRWLIDGLVDLVGVLPRFFGAGLRSLQSGMVQFYALAMVLGLLVLIASLVL